MLLKAGVFKYLVGFDFLLLYPYFGEDVSKRFFHHQLWTPPSFIHPFLSYPSKLCSMSNTSGRTFVWCQCHLWLLYFGSWITGTGCEVRELRIFQLYFSQSVHAIRKVEDFKMKCNFFLRNDKSNGFVDFSFKP